MARSCTARGKAAVRKRSTDSHTSRPFARPQVSGLNAVDGQHLFNRSGEKETRRGHRWTNRRQKTEETPSNTRY
ncbi:hypothetical protein JOB18_029199 [Solea senegalensis]|uniref:Uncharacterized protein n=1 Tax=Solea senegalensis TaxID=28829 RepID=A0AAV6T816_SOLSE|nr:hypothetical protein JOB18_029199 [Solea senegalensis]